MTDMLQPDDNPGVEKVGNLTIYRDLIQGSDEWLEARLGILTASEMKLILTPTLKVASNEKERSHLYELLAQRISGFVEPHFVSDDMLRGHEDEVKACILYAEHCHPAQNVGFMVNDKWGFPIGYSPDALVGDNGLLECKSRRQKFQVQTILDHIAGRSADTVPRDFFLQCQTGLMVSEREWLDFISYSGGLPMVVIRVYPDPETQDAILSAATAFEARILKAWDEYEAALNSGARLFATERTIHQEMIL